MCHILSGCHDLPSKLVPGIVYPVYTQELGVGGLLSNGENLPTFFWSLGVCNPVSIVPVHTHRGSALKRTSKDCIEYYLSCTRVTFFSVCIISSVMTPFLLYAPVD